MTPATAAYRIRQLNRSEIATLTTIAAHTNHNAQATITMLQLTTHNRHSRSTTHAALTQLEKLELITRTHNVDNNGGNTGNTYTLKIPNHMIQTLLQNKTDKTTINTNKTSQLEQNRNHT